MTVFKVLSEVVSAKEFLCLVALSKFVDNVEMLISNVPVWRIRKLFSTVATNIRRSRMNCRGVKSRRHASKSGARPRMSP